MIKEKIEALLAMSDEEFGHYLFSQDPIVSKVNIEEKPEIIRASIACGKEMARQMIAEYGNCSLDEYIEKLNIDVTYKLENNGLEYVYFGTFRKPNQMTIYTQNIQKGYEIALQEKEDTFKQVNFQDVIKAHELFHYFQEADKSLYINQVKVKTWKLGKFEGHSPLIAPSEIASMAFSKELNDLAFSPNVLEYVLLLPHDGTAAQNIYKNIVRFKGKG